MPKGVFKRKPFSKKARENMSKSHIGKKHLKETIEKMKGRIAWNKGMKGFMGGESSPHWKGGICSNKTYVSWLKNKRNRMPKEGGHSYAEWETLKAQYNWTCPCCKRAEPEIKLTEDHIIPLSKGGSDNIENIQPLCRLCNGKKYTKIIKY